MFLVLVRPTSVLVTVPGTTLVVTLPGVRAVLRGRLGVLGRRERGVMAAFAVPMAVGIVVATAPLAGLLC